MLQNMEILYMQKPSCNINMYGCTCIAQLLTQNKWFDMLAFTKKITEYFQIASWLIQVLSGSMSNQFQPAVKYFSLNFKSMHHNDIFQY